MTARQLILSYMRSKRLSCETRELAQAVKRAQNNVYQALLKLEGDGIVRSQRQSDNTVRWFLVEAA